MLLNESVQHLEFPFSCFECSYQVPSCSFTNIGKTENLEGVTDATAGANCSGLIDYFTSRRFLLTASHSKSYSTY